MNITSIKSDKLKFLTDNENFKTGFDIAYSYGFSENLYLGFGLGYLSSSSSIFKWEENQKLHSGFTLDGKYLKVPLSLRFYFYDILNFIKIYLYCDAHSFFNVSTDKSNNNFSDLILNDQKISLGASLGGGLNLSITSGINIFAEAFFALRPFFPPIEIKFDNITGNFKISSFVINLGLHFDFGSNDLDRLD